MLRTYKAVVLYEVPGGSDADEIAQESTDQQARGLQGDEGRRGHEAVRVQRGEPEGSKQAADWLAELGFESAPLVFWHSVQIGRFEKSLAVSEHLCGDPELSSGTFYTGWQVVSLREQAPHARIDPEPVVVEAYHRVAGCTVDQAVRP
jgi:hypothetical protein